MLWDSKLDQNVGLALGNASAELVFAADETLISMTDRAGFKTIIGNAYLVTPRTGETHKWELAV